MKCPECPTENEGYRKICQEYGTKRGINGQGMREERCDNEKERERLDAKSPCEIFASPDTGNCPGDRGGDTCKALAGSTPMDCMGRGVHLGCKGHCSVPFFVESLR